MGDAVHAPNGRVVVWLLLAVGGAVIGLSVAWSVGWVPSLEDTWCEVTKGVPAPESDEYLTVLLVKLDRDADDKHRGIIRDAIYGKAGGRINVESESLCGKLLRLGDGSEDSAYSRVETKARRWLQKRNGDLLIWGESKGDTVNLRFVLSEELLDQRLPELFPARDFIWTIEDHEVDSAFSDAFSLYLVVAVLSQISPDLAKLHSGSIDELEQLNSKLKAVLEKGTFESDEKGALLFARGLALMTIGQRRRIDITKDAAIAFDAALQVQKESSLSWAMTMSSLGFALSNLADWDTARGTSHLRRAVKVFAEAIEKWPRKDSPIGLAIAQNNLGIALSNLGNRENGTQRLEDARNAYEQALTIWTRNDFPTEWALVLNNLGVALRALGDRRGEAGTDLLIEAIIAHQRALTVRTKEDFPVSWATSQNNCGVALISLSNRDRENGSAQLNAAILRYEDELTDRAQNNCGSALIRIAKGDSELGIAILKMAVEAYNNALEVRNQIHFPISWARTRKNIGDAQKRLGDRALDGGKPHLEEAVSTYVWAMETLTLDDFPIDWALIQNSLGATYWSLAHHDLDNSVSHLENAISAYRRAREIWARGDFPLFDQESKFGQFAAMKCLNEPNNCPLYHWHRP